MLLISHGTPPLFSFLLRGEIPSFPGMHATIWTKVVLIRLHALLPGGPTGGGFVPEEASSSSGDCLFLPINFMSLSPGQKSS